MIDLKHASHAELGSASKKIPKSRKHFEDRRVRNDKRASKFRRRHRGVIREQNEKINR